MLCQVIKVRINVTCNKTVAIATFGPGDPCTPDGPSGPISP